MYSDFHFVEEFKENWNKRVKKFRFSCIILSLLMIIVGMICLFFPMQTFQLMKFIVSIVLIVFGIYSIITYYITTSYFQDPVIIIFGVTNILFGILLFQIPTEITTSALTIMLAIVLLFYGTQKIAFAKRLSFFDIINTNSYMLSGIISIVLSIIFMILPLTSAIVINYIIAAYLIVDGFTLFIESFQMKKIEI